MAALWMRSIDQGADVALLLWFEETTGVYVDLTGHTFRAALDVDVDPESTPVAALVCTVVDHPSTNSANEGDALANRALLVVMRREVSAAIPARTYNFELWCTDPLGREECLAAGEWNVNGRGLR